LAGPRFVEWFEKLYCLPSAAEGDAWQSDRLEYQFACSSANGDGEKVFVADEYHGELDWHSFDWDRSNLKLGGEGADDAAPLPLDPKYVTRSFIPAPLRFN